MQLPWSVVVTITNTPHHPNMTCLRSRYPPARNPRCFRQHYAISTHTTHALPSRSPPLLDSPPFCTHYFVHPRIHRVTHHPHRSHPSPKTTEHTCLRQGATYSRAVPLAKLHATSPPSCLRTYRWRAQARRIPCKEVHHTTQLRVRAPFITIPLLTSTSKRIPIHHHHNNARVKESCAQAVWQKTHSTSMHACGRRRLDQHNPHDYTEADACGSAGSLPPIVHVRHSHLHLVPNTSNADLPDNDGCPPAHMCLHARTPEGTSCASLAAYHPCLTAE